MVETTKKFVETTNELKKLVVAEMVKDGEITIEELQALQLYNKLVVLSNELLVKNAEMMSEMNNKLDKLLESKN